MIQKILLILLPLLVLLVELPAVAYHIRDKQNYVQVMPLDGSTPKRILFRGSRPDDRDFEELRNLGVRTVLNLESSDETNFAFEEMGFRTISVPLPPLLLRPPTAEMWEIVQILQDPRSYPLYVHCQYGKDRTGLVVALFRVIVENAPPDTAYREMLANGFHRAQLGLKCAFFETLDLPTPRRCKLIPRKRFRLDFANE